jgi:hypothetical protein
LLHSRTLNFLFVPLATGVQFLFGLRAQKSFFRELFFFDVFFVSCWSSVSSAGAPVSFSDPSRASQLAAPVRLDSHSLRW